MRNIVVKIIAKNNEEFFVEESWPYSSDNGIYLTKDFDKATKYETVLEFKVAWRLLKVYLKEFSYNHGGWWFTENEIKKIVYFNVNNNKRREIPFIKKDEYSPIEFSFKKPPLKKLQFNSSEFRKLMECGIGSSCWLYDEKNNWIAFPKDEDFKKIKKIRYYARGLTTVFGSVFQYRYTSIPSCYRFYEGRKFILFDERLQRIVLSRMDSCHEFVITESKQ